MRGRHWLSTRKHTRQGKAAGIRIQRRNSARLPSRSQVNWFCLPSAASSTQLPPGVSDNKPESPSRTTHTQPPLPTTTRKGPSERDYCCEQQGHYVHLCFLFSQFRSRFSVGPGQCCGIDVGGSSILEAHGNTGGFLGGTGGSRNTRLHRTALPLPC